MQPNQLTTSANRLILALLLLFCVSKPTFGQVEHQRENGKWSPTKLDAGNSELPTLFVASDSTAATGGPTTRGWGAVLIDYFDADQINVVNRAVGGRSFRSFTREGRWDKITEALKPGDYVVIEFGHNDGGGAKNSRGRGDVPGIDDSTETVTGRDGSEEIVHTFGWYLRKYIRDTRAKGATPIVSTTTVRNLWGDGHIERGMGKMRDWAEEVATQEQAIFIDHSNLAADHYERVGQEATKLYHPQDHTHTSVSGAIVNAETWIAGLRGQPEIMLNKFLSKQGNAISPVTKQPNWGTFRPQRRQRPAKTSQAKSASKTTIDYGVDRKGRKLKYPPGVEPGMQHPDYNADLPTLWLIGDSTVKEGRDNGRNGGRWGWGHEIPRYFDTSKINIENQALGGTSSRSFITGGWWASVAEMIQPGDFLIMQFGHNDGGIKSSTPRIRARGTLAGASDTTQEMTHASGKTETVHTYGWYLGQYIAQIRAAGATPIICSPIPRNRWKDGNIIRDSQNGYTGWAREAAVKHDAYFIDLNHIACDTLNPLGKDFTVGALFRPDDPTHTTLLGAQVNAQCVVAGIKSIGDNLPLGQFLAPSADPVEAVYAKNVLAGKATSQDDSSK